MRATAVGVLALLLGCQTYEFEPTTPIGIAQQVKKVTVGVVAPKPNVFLVVDRSGSMKGEVSPGVTRLQALQSAMDTFLTGSGSSVHLGMLPFPTNDTCGAAD